MTAQLSLPPRPAAPRPARISWAAFVTPIVMAGGLWLMTRSGYALVFAALGPIGAVISLVEGRRGARRERRTAQAERHAELARLSDRLDELHAQERRVLLRRAPGAATALDSVGGPALWKAGGEPVVRLGLGTVRSAARVDGDARELDEQELLRRAERLGSAPVIVAAAGGIAVCGPAVLARACLRGLIVQLYAAHPPGALALPELADPAGHAVGEWDWADRMPHSTASPTAGLAPRLGVFGDAAAVPPGYGSVVSVASPEAARVELYDAGPPAPGRGASTRGGAAVSENAGPALVEATVVPELVARAQAEAFATELAVRAAKLGVGAAARTLPGSVDLVDLPPVDSPRLNAAIGRGLSGVAMVDLVGDGPHAIVAGVTGSGKSELLVTWVVAMAAERTPAELVVLLVDFKGGTAFRPLGALPHTVGVITDLAHGEAERALRSLAAELRRREGELARLGVRDVADAGGELPRLVIVVDEFAAMLEQFPDFGALFTDIAARGRALGIHLILATQRPAGVMRDALVANCPLRLSLRVQSDADSRWVVGTDAAAGLSAATPGRCIVAIDGVCTEVQAARTSTEDIERIARRAAGAPPPRRPWLEPLPAELTRAMLPAGTGADAIGVVELPEEQRRALLRYSAELSPLLVLGEARSGRSSLLRLVAASSGLDAVLVGADREQAWDAVEAAADRCDSPDSAAPAVLLAIDDADAACARLGEEYAAVWCERLARVVRDGPAAGVQLVVAAQRLAGPLRSALALARETVLLRQPSRQEHVLAGAPVELYDDALPPGAGVWRGRRVRFLALGGAPHSGGMGTDVAPAAGSGEPPVRVSLVPRAGETRLVVARAPARLASRARAAGLSPEAVIELNGHGLPGALSAGAQDSGDSSARALLVGDPDAWLAAWPLLAELRTRHPIVFSGCEPADVRALTRSRVLPPPLNPGSRAGWILGPSGRLRRCVLED